MEQSVALAQALSRAGTGTGTDAPPLPNSAANYQGSFGYVEPAPRGAAAASGSGGGGRRALSRDFVPAGDLSFTLQVQGAAVSAATIQVADRCNNVFYAADLLQRWVRSESVCLVWVV